MSWKPFLFRQDGAAWKQVDKDIEQKGGGERQTQLNSFSWVILMISISVIVDRNQSVNTES